MIGGVALAMTAAVSGAVAHAMLKSGRDKLVIRGLVGLTGSLLVLPFTLIVSFPTLVLWPLYPSSYGSTLQLFCQMSSGGRSRSAPIVTRLLIKIFKIFQQFDSVSGQGFASVPIHIRTDDPDVRPPN